MKKIINKKHNKNEPWFKWLTRELNSYEAFQDFETGKNPQDVAEDFISRNSTAISEVFENFDEEDKDTLDQFLKLTECEMHVFRILEKKIELRNKVRLVYSRIYLDISTIWQCRKESLNFLIKQQFHNYY